MNNPVQTEVLLGQHFVMSEVADAVSFSDIPGYDISFESGNPVVRVVNARGS